MFYGQSSGAIHAQAMLVMPGVFGGLVHRVAVHSGANPPDDCAGGWMDTNATSAMIASHFEQSTGCRPKDTATNTTPGGGSSIINGVAEGVRNCLRNISWQNVLHSAGALHNYKMTLDGYAIKDWPFVLMQQKKTLNVPVMVGHNSGESLACKANPGMAAGELPSAVQRNIPVANRSALLPEILDMYVPGWKNDSAYCTALADAGGSSGVPACCRLYEGLLQDKATNCPEDQVFGLLNAGGIDAVYGWRVNQQETCPPANYSRSPYTSPVESYHTIELGWLFGTVSAWYISPPHGGGRWDPICTWGREERQFSNTMIQQWAHFAATGEAAWPQYTQEAPVRQNFEIGNISLWPNPALRAKKCAVWNKLAVERRTQTCTTVAG